MLWAHNVYFINLFMEFGYEVRPELKVILFSVFRIFYINDVIVIQFNYVVIGCQEGHGSSTPVAENFSGPCLRNRVRMHGRSTFCK